jgi:hypothetical protein
MVDARTIVSSLLVIEARTVRTVRTSFCRHQQQTSPYAPLNTRLVDVFSVNIW